MFIRMQRLDFCEDRTDFLSSHTTLLCLLVLRACIWCWLHFRSTWSHVSWSRELQSGQVLLDGNLYVPKKLLSSITHVLANAGF